MASKKKGPSAAGRPGQFDPRFVGKSLYERVLLSTRLDSESGCLDTECLTWTEVIDGSGYGRLWSQKGAPPVWVGPSLRSRAAASVARWLPWGMSLEESLSLLSCSIAQVSGFLPSVQSTGSGRRCSGRAGSREPVS